MKCKICGGWEPRHDPYLHRIATRLAKLEAAGNDEMKCEICGGQGDRHDRWKHEMWVRVEVLERRWSDCVAKLRGTP